MSYALSVKSQVTLPKAIRQHLGVQAGDAVDYQALPGGRVVIVAAVGARKPAAKRFARWAARASQAQRRSRSCAQPAAKTHCDDSG